MEDTEAMKTGKYVSASEIAELAGVSRQRINDLVKEGRIPCERAGRYYVYARRDIEKWLRERASQKAEAASVA